MPAPDDWTKGYSEALGMQFAFRMKNGHLETWTEDKTYYSEKEIHTVVENHGEINKQVHILKHMFNGTIIS